METGRMMEAGTAVQYQLESADGVRRGIGTIKCAVPRYGVYRVFDESGYEIQLTPEDVSPLNFISETVMAAERHEISKCPPKHSVIPEGASVAGGIPETNVECRFCGSRNILRVPDGFACQDCNQLEEVDWS